jgi:hypothetical protein
MDISGAVTIILAECDANKGIAFENHLYGCFALAEHLLDPSADHVDASAIWSSIGSAYGFFSDERAVFEGSPAYKDLWLSILAKPDTEFIETLETAAFGPLCIKGTIFFAGALSTGELPETLQTLAASFFKSPEVTPAAVTGKPVRRHHRTRGRRAVTPLKKHRFNRTKRLAISDRSDKSSTA